MLRLGLAVAVLLSSFPTAARQAVWLGFDSFKVPDDTTLSGTVSVSAGQVESVEPWLFEPQDSVTGTAFQCTLQQYDANLTAAQKKKVRPDDRVTPKGLLITLAAPESALLHVETNRGTAEVPLTELIGGRTWTGLEGLLLATAGAPVSRVSDERTNNDMPGVAVSPGGQWRSPGSLTTAPLTGLCSTAKGSGLADHFGGAG